MMEGSNMNWIKRMNNSLKYIEQNLPDNPDAGKAAKIAFSSEYHFRRMFYMISGFTLNEYIRNRKLTLAAQDLLTGNTKIIDIALKYGYETPESFSRAFSNLHGVSPREARKENTRLKTFPPLTFTLQIKGVKSMDFKIKTMDSFYVSGKSIQTTTMDGKNFKEIPAFWKKAMNDGTCEKIQSFSLKGKNSVLNGSTASVLCYKDDDTEDCWSYMIGSESDGKVKDMENTKIPSMTWAIFESIGTMPDAIQDVWKRIFNEWFPSSNYMHAKGPELEVYPPGDGSSPDYYCEVWIPVEKKQ
jgi:AraC family transcriptional regulator